MWKKVQTWVSDPGSKYVKWAIMALLAIAAAVFTFVSTKSWFFWAILVSVIAAGWYFRSGLWKLFSGWVWRLALVAIAVVLLLILYNRTSTNLRPATTSTAQAVRSFSLLLPSSWWGSTKGALAGSDSDDEKTTGSQASSGGQPSPQAGSAPTSLQAPLSASQAANQAAGCPAGFVCTPAPATPSADNQPAAGKQSANQAAGSLQESGSSLDELMVNGSSTEALAMSRRLKGGR